MLDDLRYRLRAIFRRGALERELDDELRFHLEHHINAEMKNGHSREEAERRARLTFGGVDRAKEASRDARGVSPFEVLLRDLRYAIRLLLKSPGFTVVALLSLTLGIGANTAMFQLLNALTLASLPVHEPGELAEVRPATGSGKRGSQMRPEATTAPLWQHLRERQQAFSSLAAWADEGFNLAPAGEVRRARGLYVSGDFFPTLGVTPLLGRLFTPSDDRAGCGVPGAVISYDFWQREFDGATSVIGRTLAIDTHIVDIIGVTPQGFFGPEVGRMYDVAVPLCAVTAMRPPVDRMQGGAIWWLTMVGRLKPGWTIERADAHVRVLSAGIFKDALPPGYPQVSIRDYLRMTFTAVPAGSGYSVLRYYYSRSVRLLLAMTGLVLLVACANLANLMITRGAVRSRELALRLALGASRRRLLSQLLCESLLLAVVSALAGLLLGRVMSQTLVAMISTSRNVFTLQLTPDWRVFAFTAGVAVLTCLVVGLVPALRATRGSPGDVLKSSSRGSTSDHESLGLRRALVVVQVAVSLVLVVGALLFVRSFNNLIAAPVGFQQQNVLIVEASLPPPRPALEVATAFRHAVVERLRALPGVENAAETNIVPMSGNVTNNGVWFDGEVPGDLSQKSVNFSRVTPGYFDTLRIPLIAGRDITARDTVNTPDVAVVNETFVRRIAGGKNPIGRRFWIQAGPNRPERAYEIIGIVKDAKYRSIDEPPTAVGFLAHEQHSPEDAFGQFIVRTSSSPDTLASQIGPALHEVNTNTRFTVRVFDTQIRDTLVRERVMATLSGVFGSIAGLLAAIGLYGIVSYTVERRRREIGIRLALGASRGTIVGSVLRQSGLWVAAGLALGIVASVAVTRTAQSLLFGVQSHDPATIAAGATGLALVALFASYVPAHRAARVDPMATLKDE
jgi:putative ABC transport system permease protein